MARNMPNGRGAIVKPLHHKLGIPRIKGNKILNIVLNIIKNALRDGKSVDIGIGTLVVVQRKQRSVIRELKGIKKTILTMNRRKTVIMKKKLIFRDDITTKDKQ